MIGRKEMTERPRGFLAHFKKGHHEGYNFVARYMDKKFLNVDAVDDAMKSLLSLASHDISDAARALSDLMMYGKPISCKKVVDFLRNLTRAEAVLGVAVRGYTKQGFELPALRNAFSEFNTLTNALWDMLYDCIGVE